MMIPNPNTFSMRSKLLTTFFGAFLFSISFFSTSLGATTNCKADAGNLNTALICANGSIATISAQAAGNAVIPAGFSRLYVLTSGAELTIERVSTQPAFQVEAVGSYTIHTLIYDANTLDLSIIELGKTTGFMVNDLLIQGGGDICASLDVTGVKFEFDVCTANLCEAFAGTLVNVSEECRDNGRTRITASTGMQPTVPNDFEILYVLTKGDDLVIEDVFENPQFWVDGTGTFRIHTLVYNPNTLDLTTITFGETKAGEVDALLTQGGGNICASLDLAGATFDVGFCECTADFGKISAKNFDCLETGQSIVLEAMEVVAPTVPLGSQVIYVLTRGNDLVIQAVDPQPSFTVDMEGTYRIHTLVFSPNTLDLSIVGFGKTTGGDVLALLRQGGGDICGALDVEGAKFNVKDCEECKADFGAIRPLANECFLPNHPVRLEAKIVEHPTVPSGFRVRYVITEGDELVIKAVNTRPAFLVNKSGDFTIHTLVYDPKTLDLDIIQINKTTGFDVNSLLIQGGGDICAALDVAGAAFTIEDCNSQSCKADAGKLEAKHFNCYNGYNYVLVEAKIKKHPAVPHGFKVAYVVTSGDELIIRAITSYPAIYARGTGLLTIHTLVYDPRTLDLHNIELNKTTGFDVNKLLIQGGGSICGALDVEGAKFNIRSCFGHLNTENNVNTLSSNNLVNRTDNYSYYQGSQLSTNETNELQRIELDQTLDTGDLNPKFYPNPANQFIHLEIPRDYSQQNMTLNIMNMQGQILISTQLKVGTFTTDIDISALGAGTYNVRIETNDGPVFSSLLTKTK